MSAKGTLALTGVLVLLAGAYWATGHFEQRAEQRAIEAKRVFQFDPGDLETVTIEQAGAQPVTARQLSEGVWGILAPQDHIEPNHVVWNRIASALSALPNDRPIEDTPSDLTVYELRPPYVTVRAKTNTGAEYQIAFGGLDATQEKRYARVDDGPVFLTPARAYAEFDRPLLDLRNRFVTVKRGDPVFAIEYSRIYTGGLEPEDPDEYVPEIGEESVKVILERDDEGAWRMLSPVQTKANQERVTALANELQFAVGRNYIDDPQSLADFGLEPPERLLTVRGASGAEETLLLGWAAEAQDGGGIFVKKKNNPSIFVMDGHILSLLPRTPDEFREARLLSGDVQNLVALEYQDARNHLQLEHDPDVGWRLIDPPADDTDQQAVSMYISFLKDTGGGTFPKLDGDYGFDQPRMTLHLTYDGREEPTAILVGDRVPDASPPQYYVKQEDGQVTTVPMAMVETMELTPFRFRQKELMPFRPDRVQQIEFFFEGERFLLQRLAGRWVIVEPDDQLLESQSDVAGLLSAIARARATSLADPVPARDVMGLDAPLFSVTVTLAPTTPGAEPQTLGPLAVGNLKAVNSRERFATVAGRSQVFFVDQDLIDEVRATRQGFILK